jgi:hypothetical protein
MTPVGGWEIGLLVALSALLGIYVGIRRPVCSGRLAGSGGVLGFLGVACPVCNRILLLLFGGDLLLTYFEPVRVYVAAAGVAVMAAAVVIEWRRGRTASAVMAAMKPRLESNRAATSGFAEPA